MGSPQVHLCAGNGCGEFEAAQEARLGLDEEPALYNRDKSVATKTVIIQRQVELTPYPLD